MSADTDALTRQSPAPQAGTPRQVSKRARKAQYRGAGGARWGLTLLGVLLLAAGVLTILLSVGVFGPNRPQRPLLDPMIKDFLVANGDVARAVAIVVGLVILVLGLVWTVRSLRPEPRPDLVLDGEDSEIRVGSTAAADAVADGAAALPGVTRARARMVGSDASPAVRATVWIDEDAGDDQVSEVCRRLDSEVLTHVRDALGAADLPVAVRLELESASKDSGPRVV